MVLSGKVSIYILNQDRGDEEERAELASIVQYKDGRLDREKLGNYVTTLGQSPRHVTCHIPCTYCNLHLNTPLEVL